MGSLILYIIIFSLVIPLIQNVIGGFMKGWQDADGRYKKQDYQSRQGYQQQNYHYAQKEERQIKYFIIALMAKVAKADGRISPNEARYISDWLSDKTIDKNERAWLKGVFDDFKDSGQRAFNIAQNFRMTCQLGMVDMENILSMLCLLSLLDGDESPGARRVLEDIAKGFELSPSLVELMLEALKQQFYRQYQQDNQRNNYQNRHRQEEKRRDPYEVLGLSKGASVNEIKRKYRELVKRFHPDALASKSLSREEQKAATARFIEINNAYEELKTTLGFR